MDEDLAPMPARPRPLGELARGLAVFAVYLVVTGIDWSGRTATAHRHATDILDLERRLHLDPELSLNQWLAPHHVLRVLANYEYAITYVISAFALLLWLWHKRPELYAWARTTFIWLNLVAIACFAIYPLAPPRLMPDQGFVDTVSSGHTWGSWGSPLVGHANQLAAMPSLHFGWALWVSVVLAEISSTRRIQAVSGLHVLLTLWVILATANHFLFDGVAAVVLVLACVRLIPAKSARKVAAADAFFLYVERPTAPQHVGGVVLLDLSTRGGVPPSREEVAERVREQLGALPRFCQVLGLRRWRRPVWRPADHVDWEWHVPLVDLTGPEGRPGGLDAFHRLVAELAATPLPRDRPLWRLVTVHGIDEGTAGVVLIVHHVVADGIGTVAQALRLLTPPLDQRHAPPVRRTKGWAAVTGVVTGIAQLARDGSARDPLPGGDTSNRSFATVELPLRTLRTTARGHGVRTTDVVLAAVAGGLGRAMVPVRDEVRTAVPLMMRDPATAAEGNVTAAVMVDLPVAPGAESERLTEIASRTGRLASPSRAMASRFVMLATGAVFPAGLHAWFSRTVYGHRYFSAIVSDMPGPPTQLYLLGARLQAAYPLLPLAPRAPIAVGGLSWNGVLCVGISTDPAVVPADDLAAAMSEVLAALAPDTATTLP